MTERHFLWRRIDARQQQLAQRGLLRQRTVISPAAAQSATLRFAQQPLLDFAGNDYLGLASHPEVIAAYVAGLQQYGCSSSASPLVCGYSPAHVALEQQLCGLSGAEAALLFCSGFTANNALLKTLLAPHDVVVADKFIHASMIDALRDSQVNLKRFPHNDLAAAARQLAAAPGSPLLTESIFSMDGDAAPLPALAALCEQYQSPLIIDDAHGFLLSQSLSVNPFARVVTFGKALGGQGAAVLGSQRLIDFLVANAREYIYSTALAPATCVAVGAALVLASQSQYRQQLQHNIEVFHRACLGAGIALLPSNSAIQPLLIRADNSVMQLAGALRQRGYLVGAMCPPTVAQARLRITLSARHTPAQILGLVQAIAEVM